MPTYDFRCANGHAFEQFHRRISDAPMTVECPECGAPAQRQMSAGAGLVFKGSGFYLTDYGKNAHRKSAPTAGGEKGAEKGGDAGGDGGSDKSADVAAKADGAAKSDAGAAAAPGASGTSGPSGGAGASSAGGGSSGGGGATGGGGGTPPSGASG